MHLNYLPGFVPFHGHLLMNQEIILCVAEFLAISQRSWTAYPAAFWSWTWVFLHLPPPTPLLSTLHSFHPRFSLWLSTLLVSIKKLLEETANQIYTFQKGYVTNHSQCQSMFHHFKPAYGQLEVVRKIVEEHGERRFLIITGWGFLRSNQKQPSPCPWAQESSLETYVTPWLTT